MRKCDKDYWRKYGHIHAAIDLPFSVRRVSQAQCAVVYRALEAVRETYAQYKKSKGKERGRFNQALGASYHTADELDYWACELEAKLFGVCEDGYAGYNPDADVLAIAKRICVCMSEETGTITLTALVDFAMELNHA